MDWKDYEPFDPQLDRPLFELDRKSARLAYERLMEAKPKRVAQLVKLANRNGTHLDTSDEGVQRLNDLLYGDINDDLAGHGELDANWLCVANDSGLFLGDVLISRNPNLYWEFFVWGKKDAAYQRPVVMGFEESVDPKFNVDFPLRIAKNLKWCLANGDRPAHSIRRLARRCEQLGMKADISRGEMTQVGYVRADGDDRLPGPH